METKPGFVVQLLISSSQRQRQDVPMLEASLGYIGENVSSNHQNHKEYNTPSSESVVHYHHPQLLLVFSLG